MQPAFHMMRQGLRVSGFAHIAGFTGRDQASHLAPLPCIFFTVAIILMDNH